jgi:hypothetical protein
MSSLLFFTTLFLCASTLLPIHVSAGSAIPRTHYTKPHSLGTSYKFDPRDGWETTNVTNLQYKYKRSGNTRGWDSDAPDSLSLRDVVKRSKSSTKHQKHVSHHHDVGDAINRVLGFFKGLKGIGPKQDAIITW